MKKYVDFKSRIEKRKVKQGFHYTVRISFTNKQLKEHTKGGFKTRKEARNYLLEKEHELENNININAKRAILNTIFDDYMNVVGKQKLSDNSKSTYLILYNKHIRSTMGIYEIDSLIYRDWQYFFNNLQKSKQTCIMIKAILSNTYKYALKNGFVSSNPIKDIEVIGTDKKRNVKPITLDEFNKIIDYTLKPNTNGDIPFNKRSYACLLCIGYYLGLRISEALALNKSDFDITNDTVTINKQLVHNGLKKEEFHTTDKMKTKSSKTILPLPKPLKDVLIQWFEQNPYEIACPDEYGLYIEPRIIEQFVTRMRKELDLDKNFCFHALRHSLASNLVTSGVDVATASKLLRHANITTTLNTYTEASKEDMKKAIEVTFNNDFYKNEHYLSTESNYNDLN